MRVVVFRKWCLFYQCLFLISSSFGASRRLSFMIVHFLDMFIYNFVQRISDGSTGNLPILGCCQSFRDSPFHNI